MAINETNMEAMETPKVPDFEFVILVFFIAACVLGGIAFNIYRNSQNLIENGIETKGIVIDLHPLKRTEYYTLAPSIRYMTQDGQVHVFHSSEARNPPAYQLGEEVTLYYDPKNVEEIHLKGNYLMVYVLGGMGSVFLLISIWGIGPAIATIVRWLFS